MFRLNVRRAHQIDRTRIDHDQIRTLAQAALHARAEHRVSIGGVGADHHDGVGLLHRGEVLRTGTGAKGLLQAVTRRRMAHPCTGIDIVGAKRRADHLLHHVNFFVGAARRGDAANGIHAVLGLNRIEPVGGEANRLVPLHWAPLVINAVANQRRGDAVLMLGIAPGKTAFDAGVAFIRATLLVGHHAHHLVTAQLGGKRAAHAAIGAGGFHLTAGHAKIDHALLLQRSRRAGLHAGATGDAFAVEERLLLTR